MALASLFNNQRKQAPIGAPNTSATTSGTIQSLNPGTFTTGGAYPTSGYGTAKYDSKNWNILPWMKEGEGDMAGSFSSTGVAPSLEFLNADWSSLTPGFNGQVVRPASYEGDNSYEASYSGEFLKYLQDNGYTVQQKYLSGDSGGGTSQTGLFDKTGKLIGDLSTPSKTPSASGDLLGIASILAAPLVVGALNPAVAGAAAPGGAAGAVGGTGLSVSPGAGLSLGSAGASGTGLIASPGAGLGLAGATGTGAGLAVTPSMAGAIGAGIGSSIPAGSAIGGLGSMMGGTGTGGAAAPGAGSGVGGALNAGKGLVSQAGGLISKLLGGQSGGVSGLGNILSLLANQQGYNKQDQLIDEIKSIYSPDGVYAKKLKSDLARQDAAAGRNSQYGPRLERLMGSLGDSQARALSGLNQNLQNQQGYLNGILGSGGRLFDSMGGMNSLMDLFKNLPDFGTNPEFNPVGDGWTTDPYAGP